MKSFMYEGHIGSVVEKDEKRLLSSTKPVFSFEFSGIRYADGHRTITLAGSVRDMTDAEVSEMEAFIDSVNYNENVSLQWELNRKQCSYLEGTDWYITRFLETGIPVPSEITVKRQEARESILPLESLV